MLTYPWGGNVRELKGTVRSAVLGLVLIIAGVVIINLFSHTVSH